MIRIAIVDDHPTIRAGLRAHLGDQPDFAVVGEAANGYQIVNFLKPLAVDVVILDLAMARHGGLEALRDIKSRLPQLHVLVFSGYPAALYERTVLQLGASCYLDKACDPEQILAEVRRVCISNPAAEGASASDGLAIAAGDAPHHRLNWRELQIFLRLARGESVSSIAGDLYLSTATVAVYKSRLGRKLEMKSNSEFTRYAVQQGLV